MTTRNLGEEGFRWFMGIVEDRSDPLQLGRVRVRIYNVHGDKVEAPTDTLPWAPILMPGFSASLNEVGVSSTGILVGSTVVGFFMDGNEANIPIIFGVLPGKGDMPRLAQGTMTLNKEEVTPEPPSPFRAQYPFNKVMRSESGHVVEVDDTPNFERLHIYHRTGTYTEIDQEGTRVNKIVGNDFEIVQRDKRVTIRGNLIVEVKGNVSVVVNGDYSLNAAGTVNINASRINLNGGEQGAARVGDPVNLAPAIDSGSSTVFIGD